MNFFDELKNFDPQVADACNLELERQQHNIELIASENIVSKAVLLAAGGVLTNKYAEGYPSKRYYGGCQYVDIVENIARERAKELLPSGRLNVNREELFDLRSKFGVNLQRPELASFLKDFTKRDMLRGNPSMVSKKFSEALEELKKSAVEYKKREKK